MSDVLKVYLISSHGIYSTLLFKDERIIIESEDMRGEWEPDNTAVQVFNFGDHLKITFTTESAGVNDRRQNCQTFYFEGNKYHAVCDLFRKIGFPEQCFFDLTAKSIA